MEEVMQVENKKSKIVWKIVSSIFTLGIAFVFIVLFVFQIRHTAFGVTGESMLPFYKGGEVVYVRAGSYRVGDIVVVELGEELRVRYGIANDERFMIKRVVAVAGQTVEFYRAAFGYRYYFKVDGYDRTHDFIDYYYLINWWHNNPEKSGQMTKNHIMRRQYYAFRDSPYTSNPLAIQEGYIFVLGDNVLDSLDSSFLGPIPLKGEHLRVVGRVMHTVSRDTNMFLHFFIRIGFAFQFK